MLMIRAHLATLVLFGWLSTCCFSADVVPKVLVEGLSGPVGIAVQPETGQVFVAEDGESRVVRIQDGQLQPVIVGLPHGRADGDAGSFRPIGLEFIDRKNLVLSVRATPESVAAVCIAQIPDTDAEPQAFDSLLQLKSLVETEDAAGFGDFAGVTASKSAIYVTDQAAKGWILQADIKDLDDLTKAESFGRVNRFVATQDASKVGSPAGITLSSRGEIVVGHRGASDQVRDSHLSFFRSTDGHSLLNLETGLFDIVAVRYGAPKPPTNKAHLYALDLALKAPEFGGLYRLDAEFRGGVQGVRAVKVALLDRPVAMALGNDGSMYVALLGPSEEANNAGKVLQFEPGL